MPPVIGAAMLAAAAPTLVGTTVLGVSTATIVGEVALTGALLGVKALVDATGDRLKTTVNIKQTLAPRQKIYGRTMVSGVKAFEQVRNGNLYQVLMLASHQIDGVELYYIGGEGVAVVDNLVQSAPWGRNGGASYIGFDVRNGDQLSAYGLIPNAFPDAGNFLLGGIAYVGVVMLGTKASDFPKVYPQGQDTLFRFVVRGALVYDPRNGSTAWSQNASLCIRDFLTSPDGMNIPAAYIDDASFSAFAYVCEQAVPLKGGGQEPRYTINGSYDFSELPKDVLSALCAACDAQLVPRIDPATGRPLIGITGGVWTEPTVSITSDHILDGEFEDGAGAFDAYNRLTPSFPYGLCYYQMTEGAPIDDRASQAVVGEVPQTLPLKFVTSYTQAARLGKIAMAKTNPPWKGRLTVDMTGLDAIGEPTLAISYGPVVYADPLFSTSFFPTSLALDPTLCTVDLGVSALTADAYSWNPATEEPDPPRTPFQIADYNNIDAPANAHAAISQGTGTLTWDPADRTDAVPSAQWSPAGQGQWQAMNLGGDGVSATVYGLTKGQSYDFEVAFTAGGASSTESVVAGVIAP